MRSHASHRSSLEQAIIPPDDHEPRHLFPIQSCNLPAHLHTIHVTAHPSAPPHQPDPAHLTLPSSRCPSLVPSKSNTRERCTRGAVGGTDVSGRRQRGRGRHREGARWVGRPRRVTGHWYRAGAALMGHSAGRHDRASAGSPMGQVYRETPAMLAASPWRSMNGSRSRPALRPSGRRSLEDVAEAARTGPRSVLAANLLHDVGESGGKRALEGR
jgi:hypothetical protein